MNIPFFASPNFTRGRKKKIQGVILHRTFRTLEDTVSWCFNPDSLESFHYLIARKGKIIQLVKCQNTAWHAGWITSKNAPQYLIPNPNFSTVGIALDDEGMAETSWTYQQKDALIELLIYLSQQLDLTLDPYHLIGHSLLDPQRNPDDPGSFIQWDELFQGLSRASGPAKKQGRSGQGYAAESLVQNLFRGLLNRDPNLSELDYYRHSKLDAAQIVKRLVGTEEFRDKT